MDEQNIQFPLHVQTGEEDFVIERDDDSPTSPDYYGSPDSLERGVRLKRRRRCGQCGPCQVKENCNKCHFCLRREVLKQTCIYRKCVYLRSKPKPYSRPKESPHHHSGAVNTSNDSLSMVSQDGPQLATSPQLSYTSPSSQISSNLNRTDEVTSPPNRNDVAKPILPPPAKLPDHFPFSPLRPTFPFESAIRPPQQPSLPPPQPAGHVQSPPGLPPMPTSVSSVVSQHPIVPPVPPVHSLMEQPPSLTHNHHQMMVHSQNSLGDRTFSDFAGQPMIGMPPSLNSQSATGHRHHHHPHHYPLNNLSLRDSHRQEISDTQLHYPRFNKPSIDSNRPSMSSSCVYPHSVPPSMSSSTMDHPGMFSGLDRSPGGPTYFPTNAEMFRHFPSLPPSYPYPHGMSRFGQNFTPSPYGRYGTMGMPPPPPHNLPLPRPPSTHHSHHPPWGFPPTYNCEQPDTCPKNGCCPPASQKLGLDTLVMQERYGNIHNFKRGSQFGLPLQLDVLGHTMHRPESALSNDSGRFSMTSSDFECDIISIDDCKMNAFIRSDGCNSLQIEIESPTPDSSGINKLQKKSQNNQCSLSSNSSSETSNKGCAKMKEVVKERYVIPGTVYLKQDLGDEGIIQLEIPGHKVTLEDSFLDDKLAKYSSNIKELLNFIRKEPQIEHLRDN